MMVSWFDMDSDDILSGKIRIACFVLNLDEVPSCKHFLNMKPTSRLKVEWFL